MSKKKQFFIRLSMVLVIIAIFVAINIVLYLFISRRIGNNFGGADQSKMVDVSLYLPFEEDSQLPRINSEFKLKDELPVLDGAAALVPVYAAIIDNVYPEGCVSYEGGSFSDDNFYGENFAEGSAMRYRNTIRGFYAMVDQDADIFFGAYPSEEQLTYAEDKKAELVSVPIGLEAFVFFVNKENPVDNLTAQNIRDIYSCKITNWKDVGGVDRIINPLLRIEGSGSQNAMDRFMGDVPYGQKSPLSIFGGSLGFSFRYYMEGMVQNPKVKMISVDGCYPGSENISSGEYPLTTQFYAIYRKDNENPNVEALIQWILSEEGQSLIQQCGYVPL